MAAQPATNGNAARHAWLDRERLVPGSNADPRASLFLESIRNHRPPGATEKELAATLDVTPRHLARLTRRWFGYAPHLILGVVRIASLARDLSTSLDGLKVLAHRHGYPTRQSMNRQFQSFTGMLPQAYRSIVRARGGDRVETEMSEFDPPRRNASPHMSEPGDALVRARRVTTL